MCLPVQAAIFHQKRRVFFSISFVRIHLIFKMHSLMERSIHCVSCLLEKKLIEVQYDITLVQWQSPHITRRASSSVCDDFGKKGCFSPLLASQSLSACRSYHCNIFCGSRASPLLRNLLSTSCSSVLHCCFCFDRKAKRLPLNITIVLNFP